MTSQASTPKEPKPRKPTLFDVAKEAGVSHMTVSRFVNSPQTLSLKAHEKVKKAVDSLGYTTNQAAAGLASHRSKIVALCLPDISVPVYHGIYVGLSESLNPLGYIVMVIETGHYRKKEEDLVRQLFSWSPTAVFLIGREHSDDIKDFFKRTKTPYCELLETKGAAADLVVGYSNYAIGQCVATHLIEAGKKNLAMVRGRGPWIDRLKQQYKGAHALIKVTPAVSIKYLKLNAGYPLSMAAGSEAVRVVLEQKIPPDALVFSSDIPASGALLECNKQGISVPRDLAIVGFGDYEIASHVQPALTTVRVDAQLIGRRAGELLSGKLLGLDAKPTMLDVGFELVRRASS